METEEIIIRISELETLVAEIEQQRSWQIAIKHIEETVEQLNSCWQSVDKDKFFEMQVTKIGLMTVLNLVSEWKEELEQLKNQLEARENPAKVQENDFDTELNS